MPRTGLTWAAALAMAAAAGGCASQPYKTPERMRHGLAVVLPGIEGRSPLNEAICRGLNAGGVNWGIDLEDWTAPLGPLYNLRAELHNRRKANEIAVRVAEYKFAHPDNPVVVIGHSGGGAMALWVAESMPEGQELDGVILLAPAISPGYMIDFALTKTRRGIVNFYSHKDWAFLGIGTTVTGTMDGEHTSSAGRVGFQLPLANSRPKTYEKLFQINWHRQMADTGHTGGHLSWSTEDFVATYVAPMVLSPRWSEEVVANVLMRRGIDTTPATRNRWEPMDNTDVP